MTFTFLDKLPWMDTLKHKLSNWVHLLKKNTNCLDFRLLISSRLAFRLSQMAALLRRIFRRILHSITAVDWPLCPCTWHMAPRSWSIFWGPCRRIGARKFVHLLFVQMSTSQKGTSLLSSLSCQAERSYPIHILYPIELHRMSSGHPSEHCPPLGICRTKENMRPIAYFKLNSFC